MPCAQFEALERRRQARRDRGVDSHGAAEALYDDQMVTTLDVLQDLTNDIIKELCHAIRKPGGDGPGHQISKLSVTRLKLFCILGKEHMADFKRCR